MTKQVTKGFAMLTFAVVLALVTAAGSAKGQTITSRAKVPFDFIIGGEILKAGEYNVNSMSASSGVIRVSEASGKASASRLTTPKSSTSRECKLVFHRYGQQYFLAEVWAGQGYEGRQLTMSRQERAIAKENARLASLSGPGAPPAYETVVIASLLH
jgi:hypothetical protein